MPSAPVRAPSLRVQPLSGSRTRPWSRTAEDPALRFGDPRVMALAGALCQHAARRHRFTNKSLRALMPGCSAALLARPADLRPAPAAPERPHPPPPHTNRYTLTPDGHPLRDLLHQDRQPGPAAPHAAATSPRHHPVSAPRCAAITRHVTDYARPGTAPQHRVKLTQPSTSSRPKVVSRPRSWTAATKGSAVSPGCIYVDPPDPEGRIRISAAVTAELLGEALRVVFAVRPDDEVPAVRADPPSPGGKIPGQRNHIVV